MIENNGRQRDAVWLPEAAVKKYITTKNTEAFIS